VFSVIHSSILPAIQSTRVNHVLGIGKPWTRQSRALFYWTAHLTGGNKPQVHTWIGSDQRTVIAQKKSNRQWSGTTRCRWLRKTCLKRQLAKWNLNSCNYWAKNTAEGQARKTVLGCRWLGSLEDQREGQWGWDRAKRGRRTWDGDGEVGDSPRKSHTKAFSNWGSLSWKVASLLFFQASKKGLCLVVTGGKCFPSDQRAWKLLDFFPRVASARLLPGPLVGGFLHPLRGSIFMFTGGGRCGDRISPAFGSAVNFLVILGHVWGFWSGYPSTLLPHALPAPSACSASDPVRGYIWDQNTPDSEHPRSRVGWGRNTSSRWPSH